MTTEKTNENEAILTNPTSETSYSSNVILADNPQTPQTMESAIIALVQRTDIDPERLEKFLNMQIKMEERENQRSFKSAMANFQGQCPIIKQTKRVNFGKVDYSYAPLDEIVYLIKPILSKNGLSYSFDIHKDDGNDRTLVTTIAHRDGHSESFTHFFTAQHDDQRMNEAQRSKSAITFAKRAALENALGIVTAGEDDDARRLVDSVISEDQLNEIRSMMRLTDTALDQFTKYMKVDDLSELTEGEAKRAITSLKQKRIAMGGK